MSSEEVATRYQQVLVWRAEGLNYRTIGERLGVSRARAFEIHRAALRWQGRMTSAPPPAPPQHLGLHHSIDGLSISSRAKKSLHERGLHTIGDAAAWSDRALRAVPYIGPLTVAVIRAEVGAAGQQDTPTPSALSTPSQ